MKVIWKEILMAVFMGLLLPGIVVDLGLKFQPEPESSTIAAEPGQEDLQVMFRQGDQLTQMYMDEYLLGVLLAEMPAGFETEAFKAQAVAARTYALKAYTTGGKHHDGSICGDSACCQAYIDKEDYLAKGGTEQTIQRLSGAIADTRRQVLTYEDQLIEATYFSCSGGSTEDAVAVWGADFPYLKATDSPGEEGAAHYEDTVSMSLGELSAKLGMKLTGGDWLGIATYTAGGGVNTLRLGGKEFKGTELRLLLGLRSTDFEIIPQGDIVTIRTKGFGHRVGMSQYGADAMATAGSSYDQILAHYYQGTTLTHWEN